MENRRQKLVNLGNNPQALGESKSQSNGKFKLDDDVGVTQYKSSFRPKVVQNPSAKGRQSSRASPTESGPDPIDFISSQEKSSGSSGCLIGASKSSKKSTQAPQPPPFGKNKSTAISKKPVSKNPTTSATVPKHSVARRKLTIHSDDSDGSTSSNPVPRSTRSVITPPPPSSQPPSSEEREKPQEKTVLKPAPAPFAGLARSRLQAEEQRKSTPTPQQPASPPFRRSSQPLSKPKRTASGSLLDRRDVRNQPQRDADEEIPAPVPISSLPKIPRKGQFVVPPHPIDPPTEPKKKAAQFPMSAYAKEVASKQATTDSASLFSRKRFRPEEMERLLRSPTSPADDSMNVGDDTSVLLDPRDLCPFCDEPLPDNPSPDLLQILADLKVSSKPEPRPRNPLGLTAPLTTFINLCHMHRAESTYVRRGRENNWPVVIDWDDVRERLRGMLIVDALRTIIANPCLSKFFVTLLEAVKRDGVLKAASIKGQLDNFELSHPGYYGEQGVLVFFDVLTDLFPDLSPEECSPLQPREFFLSVLIPEAAALLIEQDMDCTHDEALVILRESRQYGQMMFPDRGGILGLGMGDHMDEASAKQLQWRKDMIQTDRNTGSGDKPKEARPPPFKKLIGDVLQLD